MVKLNQILKETNFISLSGSSDIEITDITCSSRDVQPGSIFVCIKGFKTDGHKYIGDAINRGAVCLVVTDDIPDPGITTVKVDDARFAMAQMSASLYGHPSREIKVIGITGTNGKTTTAHLIKTIIEMAGSKTGLIGTNSIVIGGTVMTSERTTPESCLFQKYLRQMVDSGAKYCITEVSSHSLELKRASCTHFAAAVFTNLTHDHLDLHGSMENYAAAKAKLFEMCDVAIMNADDKYSMDIAAKTSCKKVYTYSLETKKSNFFASDIKLSDKGIIYNLTHDGATIPVKALIPGKFNVYNSLAAAAVCSALGFSDEEIAKGLIISKGAKGRAEFLHTNAPFSVMIDYAHTPDGLYNILTTVKEFAKGRIITVFGAPGDRDRLKRPDMGEIAGKYSSYCIITSDNPASENPDDIINEIKPGVLRSGCEFTAITDRKEAIIFALNMAQEGDVVLLAGKGHENYQITKDGKVPFSEEQIVKEHLSR